MRVETLVSCVDKDEKTLAMAMGLEEDGIIVNQTNEAGEFCFFMQTGRLQCVRMMERGVGLSRNTAMNRMDKAGQVCLFF